MALSPKMQKFLERLPLTGSVKPAMTREEFEQTIDSADDDFIDEFVQNCHGALRWEYVESVQRMRERRRTLFWARVGGVSAVLAAILAGIPMLPSCACISDTHSQQTAPTHISVPPASPTSAVSVISTPTPTNTPTLLKQP
jgi:hypothetical protein